ncbi:MAG: hypothetical protein ING41_05770 [Burkholderiales bacterium]|jgi:hypothetical protein|nr:hypothetical protein [Burkholderiales bacterium]
MDSLPLSDLHLALIGLAVVLLVALYAVDKAKERRALRELDARLRGNVADALLDTAPAGRAGAAAPGRSAEPSTRTAAVPAQRTEPRLERLPELAADAAADVPGAPGARIEPAVVEPASAAGGIGAGSGGWVEDPLLDCVLEVRCAHAVDGVAVFDAAASLAQWQAALPVFLVAWDARRQQWVQPDRFGFYSDLLVAVQLAHRRQSLDEIVGSSFLAAVQQIAMALDADFDAPDVKRLVGQALELDRLCARFDVQIGMTLESAGGPWDSAQVGAAAAQAGLAGDGPLRWVGSDAAGAALFAVTAAAPASDRLAFELDVPLAPVQAQPLQAMFAAASHMAGTLGASLVDDNRRPIGAGSLAAIGEQLQGLYVEMRSAGIEPGGMRAQRLYG